MACQQDAELLQAGISVDVFSAVAQHVCLSHAHSDHMRGLKTFLRQGRVYCTRVTAELAARALNGVQPRDFHILPYHTKTQLTLEVSVTALPSFHCDGSAMFLFEFMSGTRVMYTGDFRFRHEMKVGDLHIHRLYVDDTFGPIQTHFPTYEETVQTMVSEIQAEKSRHEPLGVHANILGLEPLLREVHRITQEKFRVSATLQGTWRGAQLQYLLKGLLDPKARIVLGHAKKDENLQIQWLVPTCTAFLCPADFPQPPQHKRIFFCTHANFWEIQKLTQLIASEKVFGCGTSLNAETLRCSQKSKP